MVLAKKKIQAAILEGIGEPLAIREIEYRDLQFGQVFVKIIYSGVCRSQLMEVSGGRGEDKWLPHLLGHEGAGVVVEIGPGVTKVKPGDRVVLGWIKGLGIDAEPAKYLYKNTVVNSGRVTTFSNYSVVSESRLSPMPADLSFEEAVLYGCALPTGAGMVLNELDLSQASSVVVLGLGGVGISALLMLQALKFNKIIAIDINQEKVNFARSLGVMHSLNSSSRYFKEKIKLLVGEGVDICIESSGQVRSIELGFSLIRKKGGQLIFSSHPSESEIIKLSPYDLISGKKISGSWGGAVAPDRDIPLIHSKLMSGGANLGKLIEKKYSLSQINSAISDLALGLVFRPIIAMEH